MGVSMEQNGYIVDRRFDLLHFIWTPSLALAFGVMISFIPGLNMRFSVIGFENTLKEFFIASFIMGHIGIVFFRSHGNEKIFRSFPWRFTVAPILLFVALLVSQWMLISIAVIAVWWDVYHSGLQTFGLGRIYDAKVGNDPSVGRAWDIGLNHVMYAGPILAGVTLRDHLLFFEKFSDVKGAFFVAIPGAINANQRYLTWAVVLIASLYIVAYVLAYYRLYKRGYQVAWPKIVLFVNTALVSLYSWTFNTFGEAFFIMNFFHAWQYFAIVWISENDSLLTRFGLSNGKKRDLRSLAILVVSGAVFGAVASLFGGAVDAIVAFFLVASIMHFWYDGFIWSVKKGQV